MVATPRVPTGVELAAFPRSTLGNAGSALERSVRYEEYHRFGSTSWHADDSTITARKKRYRYTGKEKDEETGLSYHGARYYAPWLGRWCSADPAGMVDGPNRYAYVRNIPIGGRDPTGLAGEELNMFDAADQLALHDLAASSGYGTDMAGFFQDLESASVDGAARVQAGGRDVTVSLQEPRSGTSASGLGTAAGLLVGGAIGSFLESPVAVGPRIFLAGLGTIAGQVPGLSETLEAMAQNEPLQRGLAVMGDVPAVGLLAGGAQAAGTSILRGLTGPRSRRGGIVVPFGPGARLRPGNSGVQAPAATKGVDLGLRGPASRHKLTGVSQKTVAKNVNTVVEPSVDLAGDVAAINRGAAVRVGDTFEINGRVYGSHDGTLFPIPGEGFHQLNRGAFKALGVLNKFGDTPLAHKILGQMHNVRPADVEAAMTAWRAGL